ncbi:MAG: hypothetical protein ACI4VE_04175 [Clostridia bacterium]
MKKQEIKNILMSMRTQENDTLINNLLGKIDMMDEKSFQTALEKVGNNEEGVRKFFESKLSERHHNQSEEKFPINDMFTYGISGNCIHLHLPGDLHQMLAKKGLSGTINTVNLQLLDAIDKIKQLRDNGFYRFQGKDSIYMISPILIGREMKFLDSMDFQTQLYRKKDLNDDKFIEEHTEARLATQIFGKDKNVGTASIKFETISSKEWQEKKREKIQEFAKKGITLQENAPTKE